MTTDDRNDPLAALADATGWLNSPPLRASELRGSVVLVEFWTYTCINWLRGLPYVRGWAAKYAGHGLVVIGVHTPEFSFESDLGNVRWAAGELRVGHPVAVDNDYAIWNAFGNRYWPARYFLDARHRIRHEQFGEGDYDGSERVVQQLLSEAGSAGAGRELIDVTPRGIEAAADWPSLRTPETYLGYLRTENFAPDGGLGADQRREHAVPARLRLNEWALSGEWTAQEEAVALERAGGRIACRFHARDVHLVLAPPTPGASADFQVRIDGAPPGAAHGGDVDPDGRGALTGPRLYHLVRQAGPVTDRTVDITFAGAGVRAYAFTFG
jgi:thiol-disulfide isomerase/thioredoxin